MFTDPRLPQLMPWHNVYGNLENAIVAHERYHAEPVKKIEVSQDRYVGIAKKQGWGASTAWMHSYIGPMGREIYVANNTSLHSTEVLLDTFGSGMTIYYVDDDYHITNTSIDREMYEKRDALLLSYVYTEIRKYGRKPQVMFATPITHRWLLGEALFSRFADVPFEISVDGDLKSGEVRMYQQYNMKIVAPSQFNDYRMHDDHGVLFERKKVRLKKKSDEKPNEKVTWKIGVNRPAILPPGVFITPTPPPGPFTPIGDINEIPIVTPNCKSSVIPNLIVNDDTEWFDVASIINREVEQSIREAIIRQMSSEWGRTDT